MRVAIVNHQIDVPALMAEVARPSNGATAIFVGTVRSTNEGREVTGIEYSAYDEMAVAEISAILEEARELFAIEDAVVEHRVGKLGIGDASIAVVAAAPHRRAALESVRYIIDETKTRAPVWKLELYADGTREWIGSGDTSAGVPPR